ncbi:MAG TPA: YggS family pyridoxal phosphate-dependent enzyme [Myxococcota bacterium]|nr:YggS family pyridoxal phosphate-dependent enzyme [Myxococcota bacterium]
MSLAVRLMAVRDDLARAAREAGRDPGTVSLIAVSKYHPAEAVCEAYDAGVRDFGENLPQELQQKAQQVAQTGRTPRWHFIGRLQRNKVKTVLEHAHLVHTVDRWELAQALTRRVGEGEPRGVLVQVNIGEEPQKGGVAPGEALAFARRVAVLPGLSLRGLMTVPPAGVDARPHFEALAALSRALRATPEGAAATELSMGMSHDFREAVHCGATMVRVGTAIFGTRSRPEEPS